MTSSRLSVSAWVTPASLSDVVPSDSRLSATKLWTSPTTLLRSLTASAISLGLSASTPVTVARFWLSWRMSVVLSCNADTRIDRFLTVEKMSVL